MSNHLDIGLAGEHYACTHLESEGYTILEKNWRYRRAEVDIICKKNDALVFVEVKTRSSDYLGDPIATVTQAKQRHLIRAADAYVKSYEGDPDVRFDIIGIIMNSNQTSLEHVQDAFYPLL